MLCNVVPLRRHGQWRPRSEVVAERGSRGWLDFRKSNYADYGRAWEAKLLDPTKMAVDVLPRLQYAKILTIKDGGILIAGYVVTFRATKSKAERTLQTWWCILHEEQGHAALQRMQPKSVLGFSPNDDDDEDSGLMYTLPP